MVTTIVVGEQSLESEAEVETTVDTREERMLA